MIGLGELTPALALTLYLPIEMYNLDSYYCVASILTEPPDRLNFELYQTSHSISASLLEIRLELHTVPSASRNRGLEEAGMPSGDPRAGM